MANTIWLSSSAVGNLLGVSPKTIARWSKEGLIGHQLTMGGHRRYRLEDVRVLAAKLKRDFGEAVSS